MNAVLLVNGSRAITRDELDTLFKEATAIVNNSPLYQTPYHPEEPLPLSAASLMTLKDAPNPPPLETFSAADLNSYGKLRWRRIQQLANEFWHRWRRDCLNELSTRQKWTKERPNLCVEDVVIMKSKNNPRNDWKTAVVDEVLTSDDGVVRSCVVRTVNGSYVRPVSELIRLHPGGPAVSRSNALQSTEI